MGETYSSHPQIVFFITSIKDSTEPQNLVTFLQFNEANKTILNIKMTIFNLS